MVDQVSRLPPAVGQALVVERVHRLIAELETIFGKPPEPGKEREQITDALAVLARFTRDVGCSWDVVRGLSDFAYDLRDLDAGRVAPLLERTKPNGNPPDSSLIWGDRVHVVVAVHALQQADPDLKHAAAAVRHIAQKFPGLQRLMTRGEDLASTILRWRRELEEAKPGEFLAQFAEDMLDMENFVAQLSPSPEQLRNLAYNTLARISRELP